MAEPTQIKTDPDSVSENIELKTQEAPSVKGEQAQQNPKGLENTKGVNAVEPESLETDSFLNALIENNQNKAPEQDTNQPEVEIEALQQLIEEGADPTQLLEETAAGEGEPTDGGGIYIPTIERTADEVLADAGFDTTTTVSVDVVVEEILINEPVVIETPTNEQDSIAGAPITLRVDDQNLANGTSPAGDDFDSNSIVFTEGSDAIASIVFGTDLSSLVGGLTWTRISENEIVGKDGADIIVRLDLSVTGTIAKVTATLNDNYDSHPDITMDDLQSLGSVGVIATDTNGDAAIGIVNVEVSDDGPSITVDVTAATETALEVDETDLSVDDTKSFANSFANNTLNAGADGQQGNVIMTYTLGITATTDSGLDDTASGQNVMLSINGGNGNVEGRTETSDILVFTVSTDNLGQVTLDQARAMVNPTFPANHNEPITLVDGLITLTREDTITDDDNDTASDTAAINIGANLTFLDDGPDNYHPTAGLLENDGSDTITESLNTISKIGADGYGGTTNVTFDVTQEGLSSFTSNDVPIYYYVSVDGKTLTGSTSATEVDVDLSNTILTVVINDTTDEYTVTMIGTVDNGSGVGFANLTGTGQAGNTVFKIVASSTLNSDLEILFTPLGSATTVNSDSDDVAVGGQFIKDGDGLRIDFGKFSNIQNTFVVNEKDTINGFRFTIDQISSGTTATLALSVSDNNDPIIDNDLTNDTPDSINKVEIYNNFNVLITTWDGVGNDDANGIIFSSFGGDVTVSGLCAEYSIVTFTNDGFDALEVINAVTASTDDGKFSLSNLKVLSVDSGSAIDLSFDTTLTDADGDTSTGTVDVTLAPDAVTVLGTSGDDLNLTGTAIDDIIFGGAGDDILIGGSGNDSLTGGSGNDTFKWQAGEAGTDTIKDWGTGTDILDLSDLLQGETESTLVNYLEFSYTASDTTLTIDVDGTGTDEQIIIFDNVDLTSTLTDQQVITSLLTNNQLITD